MEVMVSGTLQDSKVDLIVNVVQKLERESTIQPLVEMLLHKGANYMKVMIEFQM